MAALEPYRQKVAHRASRRGRRGRISPGAALADALVELSRRSSFGPQDPMRPGPRASIHVRLDHSALVRGHTVSGEICEVPGVGPVPVETVREWMKQKDAYVAAVLTDGDDIRKVVRVGRDTPAKLEMGIRERDQCCVVPGCGEVYDLQVDHVVDVAGRPNHALQPMSSVRLAPLPEDPPSLHPEAAPGSLAVGGSGRGSARSRRPATGADGRGVRRMSARAG